MIVIDDSMEDNLQKIKLIVLGQIKLNHAVMLLYHVLNKNK